MKIVNDKNHISLDELKIHANTYRPFILVHVSKEGKIYYCSSYCNSKTERGFCWRSMEFDNGDNDIHTATLGPLDLFLDRNTQTLDQMQFFRTKEEFLKWIKEF